MSNKVMKSNDVIRKLSKINILMKLNFLAIASLYVTLYKKVNGVDLSKNEYNKIKKEFMSVSQSAFNKFNNLMKKCDRNTRKMIKTRASGLLLLCDFVSNTLFVKIAFMIINIMKKSGVIKNLLNIMIKLYNKVKSKTIKRIIIDLIACKNIVGVYKTGERRISERIYPAMLYTIAVGIGSVHEETSKFIANKIGALKNYFILFNSVEFTSYFTRVYFVNKITSYNIDNMIDDIGKQELLSLKDTLSTSDEKEYISIFNKSMTELKKIIVHYTSLIRGNSLEIKYINKDMMKKIIDSSLDNSLSRKLETAGNIRIVLFRLLAVLTHGVLSWLHTKDKTLYAILLHTFYNASSVIIESSINKKFENKLFGKDFEYDLPDRLEYVG